jgi:hypothetical protein
MDVRISVPSRHHSDLCRNAVAPRRLLFTGVRGLRAVAADAPWTPMRPTAVSYRAPQRHRRVAGTGAEADSSVFVLAQFVPAHLRIHGVKVRSQLRT